MSYETIRFEVVESAARLTLNRPDRLNSFTVQMHEEVAEALSAVERDEAVRALLITGAGRGFCAGQDLADRAVAPGDAPVDLGESVERFYNPLIRRLTSLPKPVVCAVTGTSDWNRSVAGETVMLFTRAALEPARLAEIRLML